MKKKASIASNLIGILKIRLLKFLFPALFAFSIIFIMSESAQGQDCSVVLKIKDPMPVCAPSTVDLTLEAITTGSTNGLTYTYYSNPELTIIVPSPTKVKAGIYYIKGVLTGSCRGFVAASVEAKVNDKPNVIIPNPVVKSLNGRADLTSSLITSGSDTGLIFSYWYDKASTKSLSTPQSTVNGVYYLKGTSGNGCSDIQTITIND
ncbi:MAG: hypothetical protein GZ094_17870 [Mariniphaga sp.]|nr:hypothetical protein [Mariniphaga sp.]